MPIVHVTADSFDTVLSENELLLVDFWAEWCEPCKQMNQVLDKLLEAKPELVIAKIDIEAESALKDEFQVKSVPRLLLVRAKVILSDETGLIAEGPLLDLIQRAEAISEEDLESLRSQVEKG